MSSYLPGSPEGFFPEGYFPEGGAGGGSSTPVFRLNAFIDLPFRDGLEFANAVNSLGDGYEIRRNYNQAFTGADGQGGVTSHKGLREFEVPLQMLDYANSDPAKAVNILEQLYQDTQGGQLPFYFYSPKEASSVDLNGVSAVGRYLVRFKSVNPLEWFAPLRHRITLNLVEVKG